MELSITQTGWYIVFIEGSHTDYNFQKNLYFCPWKSILSKQTAPTLMKCLMIWVFTVCHSTLYGVPALKEFIRIYHKSEERIEITAPRIAIWHHEACRVMTNGDPEGRIFYPTLTRIMDSFSCLPLF